MFVQAPGSFTEGDMDEMRQHFTEREIVELGLNCSYNLGFGRLNAMFQLPVPCGHPDGRPGPYQRS